MVQMLIGHFGFCAEIKIYESVAYMAIKTHGVNDDDDSHHPDKYRSKHLKLKHIESIHTGVHTSSNQSARQLWRQSKPSSEHEASGS
jgi:hypothetical protein